MKKYVIDPRFLKQAKQNTVAIKSILFTEENVSKSSGIIIAPDKVIAALHCVSGKTSIMKGEKTYSVKDTANFLVNAEVAVLSLNKPVFHNPQLQTATQVDSGQFLFWAARFGEIKTTIFTGLLSASRMGDDNVMYYYVDGNITPGMSGAGIYNYEGALIGMVKGIQKYHESNIGIVLPVSYFLPLIYSCRKDLKDKIK